VTTCNLERSKEWNHATSKACGGAHRPSGASVLSAAAQEGDVAAGLAFAREACKLCHIVEPDDRATRSIDIGPAFRDVANTSEMTATALRGFLTTSHPKMPNLILTPEQTGM